MSNVFVLLGILLFLHSSTGRNRLVSRLRGFHHELSYRLCMFLVSPFSLLASSRVPAGTGNSSTTLRNSILEQNNWFFCCSFFFPGAK